MVPVGQSVAGRVICTLVKWTLFGSTTYHNKMFVFTLTQYMKRKKLIKINIKMPKDPWTACIHKICFFLEKAAQRNRPFMSILSNLALLINVTKGWKYFLYIGVSRQFANLAQINSLARWTCTVKSISMEPYMQTN